jgi:F-type H+-transporting ATPase subunit epsilon
VNESASKTMRLFVRGGFADVSTKGLTILAEQAVPLEQLNAEDIAKEIANAEDDLADASNEDARNKAQERLDQMRELKAALGI